MKALLVTLVLVGLAIATFGQSQSPLAPPKIPPPSAAGKSTTLKLGDKAPDFGLPNGDGKLVRLFEYTERSPVCACILSRLLVRRLHTAAHQVG